MKRITTLAHALRSAARRSRSTTNATGAQATSATEDFLVTVDLGTHSDGGRPATVHFTLGELLECDTMDKLLQRAAEKTAQRRPDPADFKGRPIADHLEARGVPEDTARHKTERDLTTLRRRPAAGAAVRSGPDPPA